MGKNYISDGKLFWLFLLHSTQCLNMISKYETTTKNQGLQYFQIGKLGNLHLR